MGAREQIQATIRSLLDKIIQFNMAKYNEYYELCLEIQRDYNISDFIDMLSYMKNCCESLKGNDEPINNLSITDVVELEQMLKVTADFIGVNTNGINTRMGNANRTNYPLPDYSYFQSQLELLLYFRDIPRRHINWTEDPYVMPFFMLTAEKQLAFLKYQLDGSINENGRTKWNIAQNLRCLRNDMKLRDLFYLDNTFMNITLRDFLNINIDGTENYTWDDVHGDGWREIPSLGSREHQITAPKTKEIVRTVLPNGKIYEETVYNRLNAKFCHKDGREVVFAYYKILINEYPDKGTYNYADDGGNDIILGLNTICLGLHNLFDVEPYNDMINEKRKNEKEFGENMNKWEKENGGKKHNIPGKVNSYYWEYFRDFT